MNDDYSDAMSFNRFMKQYATKYNTLDGVERAWARRARIERPFVSDAERIHRMLEADECRREDHYDGIEEERRLGHRKNDWDGLIPDDDR